MMVIITTIVTKQQINSSILYYTILYHYHMVVYVYFVPSFILALIDTFVAKPKDYYDRTVYIWPSIYLYIYIY